MYAARFDDLRPGRRRSFGLSGWRETFVATRPDAVPMVLAQAERAVARGHWVAGWVSYEAAPAFDPAFTVRPTAGTAVADLPLAWFAVFDAGEPMAEPVEADGPVEADAPVEAAAPGAWSVSLDAAAHAADVAAIQEAIRRGDTYQVNHTFRLAAAFDGDPAALYARLAHAQHGGYAALVDAGRWVIASASPELFFAWEAGTITCRPMKGTTARGADLSADAARRSALLGSAKDRAENLMIVDMVRNDLARLARPGTVEVTDLCTAEKLDTAWQLTSTVRARPRPGTRLADVFAALFPCASITGAPRASTMAIIAEMETTPRGVYCGAVGFGEPGPGGARWVFNVGIRTVLLDRETATAWYGTGGGITHDSIASAEYAEALLKTQVLHRPAAAFSLLETLRWTPDAGFARLPRHLSRLADAAAYFDVPLDTALVRTALDEA